MPKQLRKVLGAGLGGVGGTAVDVAVLTALVEGGTRVAPAAFAGSLAGAVVCFVLNKYWAFRDHSPLNLRQLGAFGLVAVGTALMMAAAMYVTAVRAHVPYLLAKAMCAVVVFVAWSYPAQKRVFAPAPLDLSPSSSMA